MIEGPSGEELFTIQEKKLSVRDKMEIERDGKTVATIKKALVSPLRDRYSISVDGGPDLEAKGNIVDHEFEIKRDGDKVAEISKRWSTRAYSCSPRARARLRARGPAGRGNALEVVALGLGVSGIRTGCHTRGSCSCARTRPHLGLPAELLGLASAEKLERGFDAFVLAGVGVGEEFVDLEAA